MRKILASILSLGALVAASNAAIITQFNFNSATPDGSTSTGRTTPSIGIGTASLIGGVTSPGFNSGVGSSDPAASDNSGWQTTSYPGFSSANKTAGTQYLVSTVGMQNIVVSYDLRHSNTSSRYEQVQYTINGSTWIDVAQFDGNAGDTWFNKRTVDLSLKTGVNDNTKFGFRVVSSFAPGLNNYLVSNPNSIYGTSGTWRFDMVTVSGAAIPPPPVPEPASVLAVGAGLVGLARRRKISK